MTPEENLLRAIENPAGYWEERCAAAEDECGLLRKKVDALEAERAETIEYGVVRPASMPDMSGKPTYTQIVAATFRSIEQVKQARKYVPALKGEDALIVQRRAPGEWLPVQETDPCRD